MSKHLMPPRKKRIKFEEWHRLIDSTAEVPETPSAKRKHEEDDAAAAEVWAQHLAKKASDRATHQTQLLADFKAELRAAGELYAADVSHVTCTYYCDWWRRGDTYICRQSHVIHECGDACDVREGLVCPLTGDERESPGTATFDLPAAKGASQAPQRDQHSGGSGAVFTSLKTAAPAISAVEQHRHEVQTCALAIVTLLLDNERRDSIERRTETRARARAFKSLESWLRARDPHEYIREAYTDGYLAVFNHEMRSVAGTTELRRRGITLTPDFHAYCVQLITELWFQLRQTNTLRVHNRASNIEQFALAVLYKACWGITACGADRESGYMVWAADSVLRAALPNANLLQKEYDIPSGDKTTGQKRLTAAFADAAEAGITISLDPARVIRPPDRELVLHKQAPASH